MATVLLMSDWFFYPAVTILIIVIVIFGPLGLNLLKRIINLLLFRDVKRPAKRVLEDTLKDFKSKKI